jgi:hypothetical protein
MTCEKEEQTMENTEMPRPGTALLLSKIAKCLLLYILVPGLLLWLLARPIGNAVRASDTSAFLILLAALGAVALNWLVYKLIRQKRPSLLVIAYGIFCLLAVVFVEHDALPGYASLTSTLAIIAGFLVLMSLLLASFWLAARNTKLTRVLAVGMRIAVGVILFFMAYQIIRDIEAENITRDTWITLGILIVTVLVRFSPRIISAVRRRKAENRATGLAEGRIMQIIGETHLDRDDDPVTLKHARIQYMVDGVPYETRADISDFTVRVLGKTALIGKKIPVPYDPANPADAHVSRIDRHFFDDKPGQPSEGSADEPPDHRES